MPSIVRIETSDSHEDTTKIINNAVAKSSLLSLGLVIEAWSVSEIEMNIDLNIDFGIGTEDG